VLFVDLRFFLFFAIVLAVYWSLRSNSARKNFILVASYYFYGSWDWRFAAMLFVLSAADWWFAKRLSETSDSFLRKLYVTSSLGDEPVGPRLLQVLSFLSEVRGLLRAAASLSSQRADPAHHPSCRRELFHLSIVELHD